ncbi:MATH and LRR domain-containing protein PFE0570w [Chironomus tepperi]|uniref:MATH and LRR domain-containing protein PFE0570w n=1 Tax=Chironomus tepperi TaxID=113505 RepID=UPI00391FB129
MYKRNNMLREKRKHANYKPNRRLDAKSSRGMIYENEELRIRTININAEVEKGQSEIKTLKREREQLRREIWTLRDEYDKLENLLRIKGIDPDEFLNSNPDRNENGEEDNQSECSECSCESCCDDDCCENEKSEPAPTENLKNNENVVNTERGEGASSSKLSSDTSNDEHVNISPKRGGKDRLNLNFEHLSVVTEESSEGNSSLTQNEDTSIPINDLSAFLHKVDVLSPLSYLQKLSPPLAHFENLPYEKIGGSVDLQGNILAIREENAVPKSVTIREISEVTIPNPIAESQDTPAPKKQSRLKHFFSPIRKKVPPQISQPDVFINNVIPNNLSIIPIENIPNNTNYIAAPKESTEMPVVNPVVSSSSSSFQTGGNLEELLYDIENLSKDIMELQTHCADMPSEKTEPNNNNTNFTKPKPFRSELSLVLSYPPELQSEYKDTGTSSTLPISELESPNLFYMQNLPSPYPTYPSSPLTPPVNFKTGEVNPINYVPERMQDFSHLNFAPLNSSIPTFQASSNSSLFCTVSAPSTPAFDRKCIEKFCSTEITPNSTKDDKKKAKRVSIVNVSDSSEKPSQNTTNDDDDSKESEKKTESNSTGNSHHSHIHKNHSHSHLHPKRRMSLDNSTPVINLAQSNKHKNHRQLSQDSKVSRKESNRSTNSFKKRSRSDSAFGHADNEGGTSMSERYSNSIASSRESSTSLSLKSGKRRLSITSYGGSKKIPCAVVGEIVVFKSTNCNKNLLHI